jgi:hypothetical protein
MAQKQGRRETGFAQSHDQNFLAFEFHTEMAPADRAYLYCAPRGGGAGLV